MGRCIVTRLVTRLRGTIYVEWLSYAVHVQMCVHACTVVWGNGPYIKNCVSTLGTVMSELPESC